MTTCLGMTDEARAGSFGAVTAAFFDAVEVRGQSAEKPCGLRSVRNDVMYTDLTRCGSLVSTSPSLLSTSATGMRGMVQGPGKTKLDWDKMGGKPPMLRSCWTDIEPPALTLCGTFPPTAAVVHKAAPKPEGLESDWMPASLDGVLKFSGALDNDDVPVQALPTATDKLHSTTNVKGRGQRVSWHSIPDSSHGRPLAEPYFDITKFTMEGTLPPSVPPLPSFVTASLGSSEDDVPVGSKGHATGTCRPCAHFWKPAGCYKGDLCERCHQCDEKAFRKYREGSRKQGRARNRKELSRKPAQPSGAVM